MANTKGAEKRIRQTATKTLLNKSRMNKLRTFSRKVEDFIKSGQKDEAIEAFKKAQSVISSTAQKGTLHPNAANRKISRLYSKVKAL